MNNNDNKVKTEFKVIDNFVSIGNDTNQIKNFDTIICVNNSTITGPKVINYAIPDYELTDQEYEICDKKANEILNLINKLIRLKKSVYIFGNLNIVLFVLAYYYIYNGYNKNGLIEKIDTIFFSEEELKWEINYNKKIEELKTTDFNQYITLMKSKPIRYLKLKSHNSIINSKIMDS